MKHIKLKKYQQWYKGIILLGLMVLLDNCVFVIFDINIIPTLFLYTIGKFGSLSLLNFIVYLWSRLWIVLFIIAFVLNKKIKRIKGEKRYKIFY